MIPLTRIIVVSLRRTDQERKAQVSTSSVADLIGCTHPKCQVSLAACDDRREKRGPPISPSPGAASHPLHTFRTAPNSTPTLYPQIHRGFVPSMPSKARQPAQRLALADEPPRPLFSTQKRHSVCRSTPRASTLSLRTQQTRTGCRCIPSELHEPMPAGVFPRTDADCSGQLTDDRRGRRQGFRWLVTMHSHVAIIHGCICIGSWAHVTERSLATVSSEPWYRCVRLVVPPQLFRPLPTFASVCSEAPTIRAGPGWAYRGRVLSCTPNCGTTESLPVITAESSERGCSTKTWQGSHCRYISCAASARHSTVDDTRPLLALQ